MKKFTILATSILCALPLMAQAYDAYTVADASLQAGPDMEYPSITEIPAGTELEIQGCIDGFTWCDVVAGDNRGWVAGDFLEEDFDNQRVVVTDYGPRIGIPVVGFSLGVYWGAHYHNRPFFSERTRWEERRIQPRALPRPPHAAIAHDAHAHPGARPTTGTPQHEQPGHEQAGHGDNAHERNDATHTRQAEAAAQQSQAAAKAQAVERHPAEAAQPNQRAAANARNDQRQGAPAAVTPHAPPQVHPDVAHADAAHAAPVKAQPPVQQPKEHAPPPKHDEGKKDEGEHKGDAKDHDKDH